jgi:hypothetical protein
MIEHKRNKYCEKTDAVCLNCNMAFIWDTSNEREERGEKIDCLSAYLASQKEDHAGETKRIEFVKGHNYINKSPTEKCCGNCAAFNSDKLDKYQFMPIGRGQMPTEMIVGDCEKAKKAGLKITRTPTEAVCDDHEGKT